MGVTSLSRKGVDFSGRTHARERVRSAIGVVLVHAAIAYALIAGLAYRYVLPSSDELAVFDVAEVPPPEPIEPVAEPRTPEREGAAAPPNVRARPTAIVAPPQRIRIEVAQQVGAAPVAGQGTDRSAGASPMVGPGSGAGGAGSGLGSGGAGSGTGGGGVATRARLIRGRIDDDDYPRAAYRERVAGTVTARLAIGDDGRVTNCTVTRSSGHSELDETTCRLILQRFRYAPARGADGKAVPSETGWRQTWWLEPRR